MELTIIEKSTGVLEITNSQGPPGPSAYQLAVKNGYVGTEREWLNSLGGTGTGGTGGIDVEGAQDAAAAMIVAGSHTGITATYDDAGNKLNLVISNVDGNPGATGTTGQTGTGGSGTIDMTNYYTRTEVDSISTQVKNRANHTGTQSADTIIDGTANKVFTVAMATKLGGIASGATANATNAELRDRANHTGVQTSGTISDFVEAAQDAAAAMLTSGTHTNVTVVYDDTANKINLSASGGGGTSVDTTGLLKEPAPWAANTVYRRGDLLTISDRTIFRALVDHTSASVAPTADLPGGYLAVFATPNPIESSIVRRNALNGVTLGNQAYLVETVPDADNAVTTKGWVVGQMKRIDNMPPGSTISVTKSAGGVWPGRPTARTDIVVMWIGALPSPLDMVPNDLHQVVV